MPISQVFLSNTFNEFRQTTNLVIDEINALTNGTGVLVVDGTTPLSGTFTIDGNLVVTGETTTVVSSTLSVQDNMIYLNYADGPFTITNVTDTGTAVTYTIDSEIENTDFQVGWTAVITGVNPSAYNISGLIDSIDTGANSFTILSTATGTYVNGGTVTAKASANVDLGWAGGYQTSPTDINTYAHAGIFRDATDGVFKIYEGYTLEPDAQVNIDTTHSSFSYASVAGKTFTSNNVITDDVVTDGNFVIGKLYNIVVEGNTVWTEVGATTGSVGEQFEATATGSVSPGTGTAREAEYETTAITISSDFGDLVAQRTYIDFVFTDDNSNETPQVRIGAQVGDNDKNADGIIEEGHGAFVIYTNNADTGAGAAGASLVERMRVDHLGNVGIGTNNPATALDVTGTVTAGTVTADGLTIESAGTIQLTQNTTAAGDLLGRIEFHDEDAVTGDGGVVRLEAIRGGDVDAPDFQIISTTNGGVLTNRLFLDSATGNIGIGTSSPTEELTVGSGGSNYIGIGGDGVNASGIRFYRGASTVDGLIEIDANEDMIISMDNTGSLGTGQILFKTGNTERMRITSAGKILVPGTSELTTSTSIEPTFQIIGQDAATSAMYITRDENSTSGATIYAYKSRNSGAIVLDNDVLFGINVEGSDGVGPIKAGTIKFEVDGTPATDDIPTAIVFERSDGAAGLTESMRITGAGNVGIGTASPSGPLNVHSASGDTNLYLTTGNTAASTNIFFGDTGNSTIGRIVYDHNGDYMQFRTNGSDAMRIDASGNIGISSIPTEWQNSRKAIQLDNGAAAFSSYNAGGVYGTFMGTNSFRDGVDWKYANSAAAARYQYTTNNAFTWSQAAAGTAGETTTVTSGLRYEITSAPTPSLVPVGAADDNVGTIFTATGNETLTVGGVTQLIDFVEHMRLDASGNVTINSSGTIPTGVLLGRQLVVGSATGSEIIAFREDTDVNVGDISGALLIGNSDLDGVEDHFVGMWGKVSSTNGSQDLHFAAGRSGYEGDIPQMTLDSSGNLLVGQTIGTIYNQSSVTGVTAAGSGSIQATTSAGTTLFLNRLSSDGQIIGFYRDGTTQVGSVSTISSDLCIGSSTTRVRFDDNGAITPRDGSDANSDATIDLGQSAGRFKDLHLSGTTYSSGLNIESTGNTTVNAITLDWEHLSTDVDIEQRIQWRFGDDATADSFSEAAYIGAGKEAPWNVVSNRDSYLAFGTTLDNVSDERMRITSDGNVGIGTEFVDERLVVEDGANGGSVAIAIQNSYSLASSTDERADLQFRFYNIAATQFTSGAMISSQKTEDWANSANASAQLEFWTRLNNTLQQRMTITDDGNVGIGTDLPTYKLEIDAPLDGTNGILVTNANANAAARAGISLRTDDAALDLYSTSATYNGVSGWADSGVLSTSTATSGGLKLNAQTSGIYFQTNAGGAGVRNSGTKWSIDTAGDFLASGYGDVVGSETLTTFFRRTDYNHGRVYAEEMVLSHAPEQDHVTHPYLMNDLANFVQRGGTFTKHGVDNVSAGEIRNVFRPNAKNMSSIAGDYIVGISNATFNTTYIEYTTNENHNLYAGEKVTVSGTLDNLSGSTFDVTDATVLADSLSANTFRVAASGITTTWASAGTATTQRYVITLSDLPVGLTYGGHYGISFGTKDSFHPEEVKVEVSNNNESSYTTVVDYFNVVGSIASATFASDYIEYTTVAAHGLVAGQSVLVDGTVDSSSGSSYDKTATVTVRSDGLTATSFRVSSSDPGTTHTANTGVVRAGDQERTLTSYVGYFSAGASAPTHIRYTIGRPKNSSTRLTNLYAYNYNSNGMEDYFISEGGEIGGNGIIETGNGATASVNTTTIFTYDAASTSGADIVVTATDTVTNERHIMKMLITHDANNTAATATQYGSVFTNGELADFDVSISGADVIVTATAYSTNSTTYKIMGHLLTN